MDPVKLRYDIGVYDDAGRPFRLRAGTHVWNIGYRIGDPRAISPEARCIGSLNVSVGGQVLVLHTTETVLVDRIAA